MGINLFYFRRVGIHLYLLLGLYQARTTSAASCHKDLSEFGGWQTVVLCQTFFYARNFFLTAFFYSPDFFLQEIKFRQNFITPEFFYPQKCFFARSFSSHNFCLPDISPHNFFWQIFLPEFFCQNFVCQKNVARFFLPYILFCKTTAKKRNTQGWVHCWGSDWTRSQKLGRTVHKTHCHFFFFSYFVKIH